MVPSPPIFRIKKNNTETIKLSNLPLKNFNSEKVK